jgi:hypothetical protein
VGIALEDIPSGFVGEVQVNGVITLTNWTNAIGSVNLTALGRYFLGVNYGKMSTVAPTVGGSYVQPVGRALSTNMFELSLESTIQL